MQRKIKQERKREQEVPLKKTQTGEEKSKISRGRIVIPVMHLKRQSMPVHKDLCFLFLWNSVRWS